MQACFVDIALLRIAVCAVLQFWPLHWHNAHCWAEQDVTDNVAAYRWSRLFGTLPNHCQRIHTYGKIQCTSSPKYRATVPVDC